MHLHKKQRHRWIVKNTAKYLADLDGCFIECGVHLGTSSRLMALELQRQGYLFDTWCSFPHYSKHDYLSLKKKARIEKKMLYNGSTFKACESKLRKYHILKYCQMIQGDICVTVPEFVRSNTVKIDMLHIDTDLHDPTGVCLESFLPMMSDRGIILVHDYGDRSWPGIKRIVDLFVGDNHCSLLNFIPPMKTRMAAISKTDIGAFEEYILSRWNEDEASHQIKS